MVFIHLATSKVGSVIGNRKFIVDFAGHLDLESDQEIFYFD